MSDSSYSSRPDKDNPNPIDLSRVFAPISGSAPSSGDTPPPKKPKGVSMPTVIICLVLCITTVLLSTLVAAGTFVWVRAKGITSVEKKTVIYQNVTQTQSTGSDQTPLQAQISTVQTCAESVVEILAAESEAAYQSGQYGFGSGVVWGSGQDEFNSFTYIVTNEHVVGGCGYIWIKTHADENYTYPARVIATDVENDLALLEIDAHGLRPVLPATVDSIQVGMPVFAVGNPLGILGTSVTYGGISAVDRRVPFYDETVEGNYRYMYLIQHDAAVNNGNSGGALFDYNGTLLGIVNAKMSATGVEGLGYAIPIDRVQSVVSAMVETNEAAARPLIGIGVIDYNGLTEAKDSLAENEEYAAVLDYLTPGTSGVYVYMRNKSDVPLQVGDRIVYLASSNSLFAPVTRVTSLESLRIFLADCVAGQTIYVTVQRAGNPTPQTIAVTLYAG